jgi:hypothetical protein
VVDGRRAFSVEATTPEGEIELLVREEGLLLERSESKSTTSFQRSETVAVGARPAAIRQVLPTLGEDFRFREVRHVSGTEGETFVIDLQLDGDRLILTFAPDGSLLSRRDRN